MDFQNLIICPDCNENVSIHAEICPHCGRPIKKYLEENNINDFTKGFICPRCGDKEALYFTPYRRVSCEYCLFKQNMRLLISLITMEKAKKIFFTI